MRTGELRAVRVMSESGTRKRQWSGECVEKCSNVTVVVPCVVKPVLGRQRVCVCMYCAALGMCKYGVWLLLSGHDMLLM